MNKFQNIKNSFIKVICLFATLICASCAKKQDEDSKKENVDSLILSADVSSGFFENSFCLHLTTNVEAEIFYTLDGSEPTKESNKYDGGIEIQNISNQPNQIANFKDISSIENTYIPNFNVDKCSIVKAKAFGKNNLVSNTLTQTYFVGLEQQYYANLPIISIVTSRDNLFDYKTGIYVTGETYDKGEKNGYPETFPANYNNKGKEWERTSEISLLDEKHNFVNYQLCGLRIHGGWTRAQNQKSFNIYARKELDGNKKINSALFNNIKPKTFMLRTGGYRDSSVTKVRDAMIQTLCSGLGFETQQAYPCVLFLNGEYWGIYDIQERFADSFIEEHYKIDKDNVIIFETDELDEGKDTDVEFYNSMIDFFKTTNLENDENYQLANELIDIQGFINYMCSELIVGNADWPNNNFRIWRSRVSGEHQYEDCKWRFMMYDTDDSCDMIYKCSADSNPFSNSSHWSCGPLDQNCTIGIIFSSLIKNKTFVLDFLNSFHNLLTNVLSKEKVKKYLDNQSALLKTPITKHYQRFVSANSEIYNETYFLNQIEKITSFFDKRPLYLEQYLSALF